MSQYAQVVGDDCDEPLELPTETNGDLLLSTVCGLNYCAQDSNAMRGVRLSDGRLYAPDEGWSSFIFQTAYEERQGDSLENSTVKTNKLDKLKCSDLIVLGLPWKSTEEDIKKYFSAFGELTMVQLQYDLITRQSKGCGFIRFVNYESQVKALCQTHLTIGGRRCNLLLPNPKAWAILLEESGITSEVNNKIYVEGCTEGMTAEDLYEYFSQFGEVRDVFIPKPFRSFAFITFADPYVAQNLYGDDHMIKNYNVCIGSATPKTTEKYPDDGYGGWPIEGWGRGSIHIQEALINPNTASAAVAGFANPSSFNIGFGTGDANADHDTSVLCKESMHMFESFEGDFSIDELLTEEDLEAIHEQVTRQFDENEDSECQLDMNEIQKNIDEEFTDSLSESKDSEGEDSE